MAPAVPPSSEGAPRSTDPAPNRGPTVLDLVRLSPEPIFPPGGEPLYRQIGILTELAAGFEVLDVACGRGVTTAFLASTFGVEGTGVDPNPRLVEEAERYARKRGLGERLTFECAPLDDLPYQDAMFDVAIGEVSLAAAADPAAAVRELARVTKPYGWVVLVQLVWTGHVEEEQRETLVRHLGARPLLLVEWKQLLREAGCVDLHVEDWSDYGSVFRPLIAGPFPDSARTFTFRQRLTILRRALFRWGWRGVRGAIVREHEIQRLLTKHRVLGLSMIRATRWPDDVTVRD